MTQSSRSISIAHSHDKPNLSKGQKTFNSLIKQIDKRRKLLRDWELVRPHFQEQYVNGFLPLTKTLRSLQIQVVQRLDQSYDRLNKTERQKVYHMIVDLTEDLIDESDDEDEIQLLKAIHDKYSPTDYDNQMTEDVVDMKYMLESMFGVDLGDDEGLNSPQDLMQRAQAHIQQVQSEHEAKRQAEFARRDAQRAKRKKSPKQQAAEAQAQERQEQINLSIREVYRKLASALHPDREPDPQERERKTLLMQRVNEAYQKNNLLQLLELQLQLEHIDQHALNNISEDRLKHYNTILKEQVAELDREIMHVEMEFQHSYGIDPFSSVSPNMVMKSIASDLSILRQSVQMLERDLVLLKDIKGMKHWIKQQKKGSLVNTDDLIPF